MSSLDIIAEVLGNPPALPPEIWLFDTPCENFMKLLLPVQRIVFSPSNAKQLLGEHFCIDLATGQSRVSAEVDNLFRHHSKELADFYTAFQKLTN